MTQEPGGRPRLDDAAEMRQSAAPRWAKPFDDVRRSSSEVRRDSARQSVEAPQSRANGRISCADRRDNMLAQVRLASGSVMCMIRALASVHGRDAGGQSWSL